MAEFSSARRFAAIRVRHLQESSLRQSDGQTTKWFVPLERSDIRKKINFKNAGIGKLGVQLATLS